MRRVQVYRRIKINGSLIFNDKFLNRRQVRIDLGGHRGVQIGRWIDAGGLN